MKQNNLTCNNIMVSYSFAAVKLQNLFHRVPEHLQLTANLRHYLHSPIPNIIKIRDKYRIFKLNSRKNTRWYFILVNYLILVSTILAQWIWRIIFKHFLRAWHFFATNQPTHTVYYKIRWQFCKIGYLKLMRFH